MMFSGCSLHIGMEKTGTTSIQAMMSQNRAVLAEAGYCYSHAMGRDNHVNLVVYARDDDTSDNQRKRALANTGLPLEDLRTKISNDLAAEAAKNAGKKLILSNEHLQSRLTNIGEKQRLKSLLEPLTGEVDIYLYLRRQDKVATSIYGTRLLSGALTSLKGGIMPSVPGGKKPYFYDYLTIWREFCTVFGKDHVHLRLFDPAVMQGGDICSDYLDWMGIDPAIGLVIPPRTNESISEAAQFLMTRMNKLNPPFLDKAINPLRGGVDMRLQSGIARGKGRKPHSTAARAFYDHFRDDNAILFAEAGLEQTNFKEDFDIAASEHMSFGAGAEAVADVATNLFRDTVADLNDAQDQIKKLKKQLENLRQVK